MTRRKKRMACGVEEGDTKTEKIKERREGKEEETCRERESN